MHLKEFRVQKVRDQCRDKRLHIARTVPVPVNCMHHPMYTFSENIQRSAADLEKASLGSQASEERERERERESGGGGGDGGRGGREREGLKGSAHFALQILVYIYVAPCSRPVPYSRHSPYSRHFVQHLVVLLQGFNDSL